MGEDRRRHYDDGFRREALEPVRAGAGSRTLARRLAMPRQTPKQWILLYGSNGEDGLTVADVMAKYGIANIAPLNRWCRDYRTGGEEALRPKPKGRPKGVKSKPKPKPTREHELAEENAYLRAKVAYLKKLRSLRANKSCGASEAPSSDCSQGKDTGSTPC